MRSEKCCKDYGCDGWPPNSQLWGVGFMAKEACFQLDGRQTTETVIRFSHTRGDDDLWAQAHIVGTKRSREITVSA